MVGAGEQVMPIDERKDERTKQDDKCGGGQGHDTFRDKIGKALGLVVEVELRVKRLRVGYVV